jgi:hypothetical protein
MPVVPKLLRPSVLIRRNAVYKGLLGGSKGWLAIGGVLWSKSFLKKTFGKNEEFLTVEKLTKGQFLRIDAVKPPSRRQRKKARRAAKREEARAKADRKQAAALASAAKVAAKRQRKDGNKAREHVERREFESVTGA